MRKGCKSQAEFVANVRVAAVMMLLASIVSDRVILRRIKSSALQDELTVTEFKKVGVSE
jgi:hypothetical protein